VNERTCRVKFDFLEEGTTYTAYIYQDGSCRSELKFEKKHVKKGQSLSIKELSEGGFLIQVSPNDNLDVPQERTTYEAEASANTLTGNTKRKSFSSLHASGGNFVGDLGLGGKLQFNRIRATYTGEHILTIYYISKDTRKAKLLVNDVQIGDTITFNSNSDCTSTWDPEGMSWMMIPVTLNEGYKNTVTIQAFDDLWGPNFDRITIHPALSADEITGLQKTPQSCEPYESQLTYSLHGYQLPEAPQKGIYIHNGKKLLKQ